MAETAADREVGAAHTYGCGRTKEAGAWIRYCAASSISARLPLRRPEHPKHLSESSSDLHHHLARRYARTGLSYATITNDANATIITTPQSTSDAIPLVASLCFSAKSPQIQITE